MELVKNCHFEMRSLSSLRTISPILIRSEAAKGVAAGRAPSRSRQWTFAIAGYGASQGTVLLRPRALRPVVRCSAVALSNGAVLEAEIGPGDVLAKPDETVVLAVQQPHYAVRCVYQARGHALEGAARVWAHVGHSGWQDTQDVELQPSPQDPQVWLGTYKVPIGQLSAPNNLDIQMVFKGEVQSAERWDNNGGHNWALKVEVTPGTGVVAAPENLTGTHAAVRAEVSSLLLRVEALTAGKLLTREQGALLRTLAWQRDFALLTAYKQVRDLDDSAAVAAFKKRCGFLRRPGLHVVHIASEMHPVAKVGGLADVVTSLAKAHQATGTLAEIILPKYDCLAYKHLSELRELATVHVDWGGTAVKTVVWSGVAEGLPVYLIEPYSDNKFFWRGQFYGEQDDMQRFLFFSRAALDFLVHSGKQPDIIHIHDWQSAAIAPLLKEEYRLRGLTNPGVVLTIHNIAFQGWLTPDFLTTIGLDAKTMYHPDKMLDDTRPGFLPGSFDINLLKGGVVFADRVTTVSPTYAREVFDPVFGMGMQGTLAKHAHKFSGVLNGIDHETWDPATDPLIPHHYSASDTEGKAKCKEELLRELGMLPPPHNGSPPPGPRPLVAVVSRLTEQKGLPLILAMIGEALRKGAQVVVLGSAPDTAVNNKFKAMAADYAKDTQARLILRYDDVLAHRIYAGADIILIPSFFEPCGLTQLIGLRYGTVPVVRETGGLADTVKDVAHSGAPEHERNGFAFAGRGEKDAEVAVGRAIDAYRDGHDWWKKELVPRVMRQDWSWSRSAQQYLELYRGL